MHEISICEGLVSLVEKQKKLHDFSRVLKLQVACGVYNCVSEETLNFCFHTIAKGTYMEDAMIAIHRLPERWSCPACKADFVREDLKADPVCTRCGAKDVLPLLNSEIYLDNLEVE
jgi:hydrogenase nickel incorporation protein HypA/HybF